MLDQSSLDALELRLSHERTRLANAAKPAERELRAVWVEQMMREVAGERLRLGLTAEPLAINDDDLLAELGS